MTELTLREAVLEDIDSIVLLWKKLMEFHIPFDPYFQMRKEAPENFLLFLKENMENKDRIVYVAEINQRIVGYMMGMINNNPPVFKLEKYGEIVDAFVDETYRKHEIGSKLFQKMKIWFISKGLQRIDINAAANNPISNKFWRKMGFTPYLNHMHYSL